jgi:hypothetical protein
MSALGSHCIQDYPYPVALPYRIARDEGEELLQRMWAVLFAALHAVKHMTIPLVTQYLDAPVETEVPETCNTHDTLNRAITGIRCSNYSKAFPLMIECARGENLSLATACSCPTSGRSLGMSKAYGQSGEEFFWQARRKQRWRVNVQSAGRKWRRSGNTGFAGITAHWSPSR